MSFFDENFNFYREAIDSGKNFEAVQKGLDFLGVIKECNADFYENQHKGSPFYVLGYAAFKVHDFTSASLYFDAAVSEDKKNFPADSNKPALRFLKLQCDDPPLVLADGVIREIKESVDVLLNFYNQVCGATPISLDDLRSKFLGKMVDTGTVAQRVLVTAFLSYAAERPYRLKQRHLIPTGSPEPLILHLLRGCVLFESLLKEADTAQANQGTLGKIYDRHSAKLGKAQSKNFSANDFSDVLSSIHPNMLIENCIETCGKARNTLAHQFVWNFSDLTAEKYDDLSKSIAAACLHVISKLYH